MSKEDIYFPLFDFAKGETLLIDKPYKWTSFDVVKKIRNAVKIKKVGHAGTLDPLATGLLIVCTGKKTKTIDEIQGLPKVYTGSLVLGKTTPSFDLETEVEEVSTTEHITEDMLLNAVKALTGEIDQIPPLFSAVKVNGKRAYKHARKNEDVALKSRKVQIHSFEITSANIPEINFKIKCSKGTYIRSLARDLGASLKVGAYLSSLKRTAIGDYSLNNAYELNHFINQLKS